MPGRLTALGTQDASPTAAATQQPPAVPELADLIPLTTALSDRLASLKATLADNGEVSQLEHQLEIVNGRVEEDAKHLVGLKASTDQRAGRLTDLKARVGEAGETLAGISKAVSAKVRTFGTLHKEWSAEQTQWSAWQATLRKEEPFEEITATVTRAENTIATAVGLLRQQLKPLLALQTQVGTIQTKISALTAEIDGLLSLSPGGGEAAPSMLSARYRSQLASLLRSGGRAGLLQISWPGRSFVSQHGWVLALQAVLSCAMALVFFRYRHELAQVEDWRFIAARPVAAGILVGILSAVALYEQPPNILRFALSVILGTAFMRLSEGLVERGWRRQVLWALAALLITTNLVYALGLPDALFRLYVLVVAVATMVGCLRGAAVCRRLGERWFYVLVFRAVAILCAGAVLAEIRGNAKLAEFLIVALLRTLGLLLLFGLLRHLMRGGLEWVVQRSAARGVTVVRNNPALVVQRLAVLGDLFVGALLLSVLLMVWQVYDSPAAAITGVLSRQLTVGAQQITIGLVLLAAVSLGASYLASWLLQTLVTENVLARRKVDTGVGLAITRLIHYALVSVGFVIALAVLGVDLTHVTLLISALGVGIGFGLQTVVNNFVCGLILLFERPLRVGDTIELGGRWAKIAKIGLRSTTVRTLDQADVIVPNADLITNQVTNWTLTDRHARAIIAVKVAAGSDVALVMRTLQESALADPGAMKDPAPRILFRNLGAGALEFELHVWIVEVDHRLQVESDLRQDIERRFRQAGIQIAS